jgi:hypothetical protein
MAVWERVVSNRYKHWVQQQSRQSIGEEMVTRISHCILRSISLSSYLAQCDDCSTLRARRYEADFHECGDISSSRTMHSSE